MNRFSFLCVVLLTSVVGCWKSDPIPRSQFDRQIAEVHNGIAEARTILDEMEEILNSQELIEAYAELRFLKEG
jgi:hypothetical protein